jgi:hypothetical protein
MAKTAEKADAILQILKKSRARQLFLSVETASWLDVMKTIASNRAITTLALCGREVRSNERRSCSLSFI